MGLPIKKISNECRVRSDDESTAPRQAKTVPYPKSAPVGMDNLFFSIPYESLIVL